MVQVLDVEIWQCKVCDPDGWARCLVVDKYIGNTDGPKGCPYQHTNQKWERTVKI